ncbi:hypothetical protein AVT69_gp115 [Pseudomonas phage PhiPA3]|uniref:Uncharacterized protein 116 n=1 Tax=Pseudomonas phage PhiPA3 TaxID=998086 RepID=F8SJZ0_BPPA3|nr:hypothetical protein AVT69_gp115 [Pseudomonas phage PhiPA3]AEH03540.1 hypothetical protein [Pseudomonas phage PhiPA3]
MSYRFRQITSTEARELPNGEYDTCPLHGPQVYMPERRVRVKNGSVRLLAYIDDDMLAFSAPFFFEVNVLVEKQDG